MSVSTEQNQRILTNRQIQRATGVIAAAYVLSALLGVARQAIIGSRFGAGSELDAFYAAYRIPELLFMLVAGGALGSAFIPIFGRFLGQDDLDGAWQLASAVMTLVALLTTVLAIFTVILGAWITSHLLIPEASPAQQALTTNLMRLMLCTVVIFSLSGLVMGILNANQHFLTPALAPSMNNIGLILGAIFLAPSLGVYGLVLGAVAGALLHLGIQLPALHTVKPHLRLLPDLNTPGVKEVLWLMGPRVIGSAVVQINFLVNTALSSGMAAGSFTALTVAFSLMFSVLGVLGQSVGTAVFPSLAALGARNDLDGFRNTLLGVVRGILFTSLPASVGILCLASPLVATIYQRGRWSADDTVAAAWALQFFAIGLVGFSLQEILARAFYALRDTATPVIIAVGGMILNVILSLLLIRVVQGQPIPFGEPANPLTALSLWIIPAGQGPFGGLALANALATLIESLALWLILSRRLAGIEERRVLGMSLRTLVAALVMGAVVVIVARQIAMWPAPFVLIVGTIVGAIAFEAAALALGVPEARSVPGTVLRRFKR
ncbi:MAG: murein biosynthesis integral membrane protein MurJ [Chloroflexota bacterium]